MGTKLCHRIGSGSQCLGFQCSFTIGSRHFRRNNTIEVFFQIYHVHRFHHCTVHREAQISTILFAIDGKSFISTAKAIVHIIADHQQIFAAARKANTIKITDAFCRFFRCTFYLGTGTILHIYRPFVVTKITAGCIKASTTQTICQIFRIFLGHAVGNPNHFSLYHFGSKTTGRRNGSVFPEFIILQCSHCQLAASNGSGCDIFTNRFQTNFHHLRYIISKGCLRHIHTYSPRQYSPEHTLFPFYHLLPPNISSVQSEKILFLTLYHNLTHHSTNSKAVFPAHKKG